MFKKSSIFILIFSVLATCLPVTQPAQAATNLIKQGGFEDDVNSHWNFYLNENSGREFDFYRSYDAPFGYGSYSAAIDASGAPEDAFNAILTTKLENNSFNLVSGRNYFLVFFAKASQPLSLIPYIQRADNYNPASDFYPRDISTTWEKYVISLSPEAGAQSLLAFVVGDMPAGSSLYLDGIQLFEQNIGVPTAEIRGKVGATDRFVTVRGIANFDLADVEIELPFFDNLTRSAGTRRFQPERITPTGAYFNMYAQTFTGIGRVYLAGNYAGEFNYHVAAQIDSVNPALVRADSDLTVIGSGFSPVPGQTFLVVKAMDSETQVGQRWIEPKYIDSNLTQMTFDLPSGLVNGTMYVQTSYSDMAAVNKVIKSNEFSYKIRPIVYATDWSERGYEHVGDKLLIYGRGFGKNPYVAFYGSDGEKLETKQARITEVREDVEIIEVPTTKKSNSFSVVAVSEGIESELATTFSYLAKPKINKISSQYSRRMNGSEETVPAGKIGDIITINGEGFRPDADSAQVEFQGANGARVVSPVDITTITNDGRSLKVTIPQGAVNGYIGVDINGTVSNYLPLEIVPTVLSVAPDPIVPGQDIVIRASGINDNLNLAKVHFNLTNSDTVAVNPHTINIYATYADVIVRAPLAISNDKSKLSLQYDRWKDDGSTVLNVNPTIVNASINLDNDILSIKGYGFSISPKENQITYMYADQNHTVIDPTVKILGVYPTEEGQEIRVKISDHYYYGYVTVTVDGQTSNEANFGPTVVSSIARRIEFVPVSGRVRGVLYINGYNFGSQGTVMVGNTRAEIHYRSNYFIIAVVDEQYVYDNPVVINREDSSDPVPTADTSDPVITIIGDNPASLSVGEAYTDAGATAMDNVDGNISQNISVQNNVNSALAGTYSVVYTVSDAAGNSAQAVRQVVVAENADTQAPVITLNGSNPLYLPLMTFFVDPGATALDNVDGDLTSQISSFSSVNFFQAGNYAVEYYVSDSAGNEAHATRTVIVY